MLLQRGIATGARPVGSSLYNGPVRPRSSSRLAFSVRAEEGGTKIKGKRLDPEKLVTGTQLGAGSFGEAYKGTLTTPAGERQVVLKRVKARVTGAQEMQEAEQLLNVLANKAASDAVAQYLGYAMVEEPVGRLTKGLWLVWAYEGDKTLAYYLKRRDCEQALAADLGVAVEAAVPLAMKQIFDCLVALHNVGIVHRDIKPANIVFDEQQRRFRLIDLGAAVCLRTGTNYKPDETILDPCYCPPEEYVLPTDAPHLAQKGVIRPAMSIMLWTQHRPDCFDTYSAGIVLMQLSLPFLRNTSSLRTFNGALARCKHDLEEWREKSGLPARQTAILDANNGAGWDLAASLLRPREVFMDDNGGVKFINNGKAPRLSASTAVKHAFIKAAAGAQQQQAAAEAASASAAAAASSSRSGSGGRSSKKAGSAEKGFSRSTVPAKAAASGGGGITSMWGRLKGKLFDLEARVMQEATATEVQTTVVQQLRSEAKAGKVSEAKLRQEEEALQGMQRTLQSSVKEMNTVFGAARGFLSAVLGGSGSGAKGVREGSGGAKAAAATAAKEQQAAAARQPDMRMPKWAAKEVPLKDVPGALYGGQRQPQQPVARMSDEEQAEAAGAAAAAAVGDAAIAATSFFAQGLKFTANAVSNLSSAADKMRVQRQAAAAYVRALQQLPLNPQSRWDEVMVTVPDAPEYTVLTEKRREEVFRAYIGAIAKKKQMARSKALAAYQELMATAGVGAETTYAEFEFEYGSDERFIDLTSDADRVAAFDMFTSKLQAAREAVLRKEVAAIEAAERATARVAAEAAARATARAAQKEVAATEAATKAARQAAAAEGAEAAYRQLMQEHQALIASGAGYPQLKLKMWADPRFEVLPEPRRRQLYGDYHAMLEEAGLLASQQPAAPVEAAAAAPEVAAPVAAAAVAAAPLEAAAPAASSVAVALEAVQSGASKEQLEWLRQEQARLKEEYAKMEAKLREMEQRLGGGAAATAVATDPLLGQKEADGGISFRFGDALPTAADYSSRVAAVEEAAGVKVNGVNGKHAKI